MRAWRRCCSAVAVSAFLSCATSASAQPLDQAVAASEAASALARQSQQRIDALADETQALLDEYRRLVRQSEGLDVYNTRLERQIGAQEQRLARLDASFVEATELSRQVLPLLVRMIDSLEAFIALDRPFSLAERHQRIALLRRDLDRPEMTLAEKFRQVLDAYRIEIEFGRKIDSYRDTIELDGEHREVDILRVGRIALLYCTPDGAACGQWNPYHRAWEALAGHEYVRAIRAGIRMAKGQAAIDLLRLPVAAPEAAR